MNRWLKSLALVFAAMLVLVSGGCAAPADPAARMLEYLERNEYSRVYALLDPETLNGLTLAELTDRFSEIYSSLGITDMDTRILRTERLSDGCRRVTLLTTYQTKKLGEINAGNTVIMNYRNGKWLLEWQPSLIFPGLEEGDSLRLNNMAAKRGEIFDINGELLVQNDHAITVYVQSDEIKDPDTLARLASPLLEMTETDILKRIDPDRYVEEEEAAEEEEEEEGKAAAVGEEEVRVARAIPLKIYPKDGLEPALEEQLTALNAVHVDRTSMTPIRYYPYGSVLAHTLGYSSVITAEDKESAEYADLADGTLIGRTGLEAAYDGTLRGISGYELAIYDKTGVKKQILAAKPAVDGSDLRLTVDLSMQQTAETLLLQNLTREMSAAVIVLDPETGAIDAIASYPTFDANIFSYAVSTEYWDYFMDEANRSPLYNRATLGLYPPGSTLKPFVGAAGLSTGAITLGYTMSQARIVNNEWQPDDERWVYPPIRRVSATPDPLNLYNAIVNSDNIFFAHVALLLGEERLRQALEDIGFSDSGFTSDLPISNSRISNEETFSSQKLLADSGYGQGELLITPVQMAATFSALANGGDIYRPYLVSSVKRTENRKYVTQSEAAPTLYRADVIPADILESLQPMLRGVVTAGTGRPVNIKGMDIHAKTGTAQVGSDNSREIAWLIGYNAQGDVRRLVCVMVEVPADEGSVRNGIAKGLFEAIQSRFSE